MHHELSHEIQRRGFRYWIFNERSVSGIFTGNWCRAVLLPEQGAVPSITQNGRFLWNGKFMFLIHFFFRWCASWVPSVFVHFNNNTIVSQSDFWDCEKPAYWFSFVRCWISYLIGRNFVGKKWRKNRLVTKFFTDEYFLQAKLSTAEYFLLTKIFSRRIFFTRWF